MKQKTVLFGVTTGIVVRSFFTGLFGHLRSQGWRVILVSNSDRDAALFAEEEGAEFRLIDSVRNPSPRNDLTTFLKLRSIVLEESPDICVWGTPKVGLLGSLASRSCRVTTVYVPHGLRYQSVSGIGRLVLMAAEALACRAAHRVYTVGEEVRQTAIRDGLVKPGRIAVVANGSANGVVASIPVASSRRNLGVAPDSFVAGFVGRVTRDKGIWELLQAWERFRLEVPNSVLIVAGMFERDAEVGGLADLLGRSKNVVVLGHVEDLSEVYSSIDVLVLPSYREGLPTVVLEAATFKVPSIVTNATGVSEPVMDGRTGIVIDAEDSGAIYTSLVRLSKDRSLRESMGQAAYDFVLDRYSRNTVHRGWNDALTGLLTRFGEG